MPGRTFAPPAGWRVALLGGKVGRLVKGWWMVSGKLKAIPMDRVVPTVHNTRIIRPNDPTIRELADSIAKSGLLQPVVCRPIGDQYELLAGRRRFEAHKLLGSGEILAVVSDLDDQAALDVIVTENLQREGLTPLEESRGVALLLKSGREIADVAARLGKSEAWVRRRARLAELTPEWLAALEGPVPDEAQNRTEHNAITTFRKHISAAVLEIAASLPVKLQKELLKDILSESYGIVDRVTSVKSFKSMIAGHCRTLDRVPWNQCATLHDEKGNLLQACDACCARTDREPDLFGGLQGGWNCADDEKIGKPQCLDAACYKKHYEAAIAAEQKIAESKFGGPVQRLSQSYSGSPVKADLKEWNTQRAKKGEKGAVPVIVVDGTDAGKTRWVKIRSGQQPAEQKPRVPTRRELLLKHMAEQFNEWLDVVKECPLTLQEPVNMCAAIAMFGFSCEQDYEHTVAEIDFLSSGKSNKALFKDLWSGLKEGLEIYVYDGQDQKKVEAELDCVLHVCGLDKQDFLDKAELAHPEPEKATEKKSSETKSGKGKKGAKKA